MDVKLLQRYDAPVPRYTSYPTAPQFHPGVNAATYRKWLENIGEDDAVSLYFHVPFCTRMCWYCGCHTKVVRRYTPVADYADLLHREIALVAEFMRVSPTVTHVHWGGGTPTMLSEADFADLMATAREHFRFADDAEVAVEIDPRTLNEDKAKALAAAGVTRASLGVQDFNDAVQQAVDRVQPYEMTAESVTWLRAAGISRISFDLMYGLPRQTVDDAIRTADLAAGLEPDRIAIFGYAHVPWMKSHQKMIDEATLPDSTERLEQSEASTARLVAHGYRRIGLDHFARPDDTMVRALDAGNLKRNFQGYTTDRATALIGFGASAIGSLREGYVQNAAPFKAYADAIKAGRPAVTRGVRLDDDDRLRRAVIERLMCDLAVDLDALSAELGAPADGLADAFSALEPMREDGLVEIDGNRITITEEGRPLMRSVCAAFDRYLGEGPGRHSRAV